MAVSFLSSQLSFSLFSHFYQHNFLSRSFSSILFLNSFHRPALFFLCANPSYNRPTSPIFLTVFFPHFPSFISFLIFFSLHFFSRYYYFLSFFFLRLRCFFFILFSPPSPHPPPPRYRQPSSKKHEIFIFYSEKLFHP